jgi:hypothetical protein
VMGRGMNSNPRLPDLIPGHPGQSSKRYSAVASEKMK